jgi:hypothetical protein
MQRVKTMPKYDPLCTYLRAQHFDEVPMTFAEIERVIGAKLPEKSQAHRAWWSNNPSNSVMTKAWLDAGYRTERVDMAGRKLVFRRVANGPVRSSVDQALRDESGQRLTRKRHPLFGALAGLTRAAPGADLTQPADPNWGDLTQ